MTTPHIPDVVIERYRLNELPALELERIERRLRDDPALRARVGELEASDGALHDEIERIASRLEGRVIARPVHTVAWAVSTATVAAAVLLAVVVHTHRPSTPAVDSAEDRVKGVRPTGPDIAVFRRTGDGSERLSDGAVAHAGDLIRVGYRPAGRTFGVIVSIDALGHVTRHLPPTGDRAAHLKGDAMVLLDQAYELDDAPQWERFYFIAGDTAFDVAPVLRAVRDGVAPPRGLDQSIFTLRKESSR
jgi:anti-sigma factor RsiW